MCFVTFLEFIGMTCEDVTVSQCSLWRCIRAGPSCSLCCTPDLGSPAWLLPLDGRPLEAGACFSPYVGGMEEQVFIQFERVVIGMNGVSCDQLFFYGKGKYSDFSPVCIKWSGRVFYIPISYLFHFAVRLVSCTDPVVPVQASQAALTRDPAPSLPLSPSTFVSEEPSMVGEGAAGGEGFQSTGTTWWIALKCFIMMYLTEKRTKRIR